MVAGHRSVPMFNNANGAVALMDSRTLISIGQSRHDENHPPDNQTDVVIMESISMANQRTARDVLDMFFQGGEVPSTPEDPCRNKLPPNHGSPPASSVPSLDPRLNRVGGQPIQKPQPNHPAATAPADPRSSAADPRLQRVTKVEPTDANPSPQPSFSPEPQHHSRVHNERDRRRQQSNSPQNGQPPRKRHPSHESRRDRGRSARSPPRYDSFRQNSAPPQQEPIFPAPRPVQHPFGFQQSYGQAPTYQQHYSQQELMQRFNPSAFGQQMPNFPQQHPPMMPFGGNRPPMFAQHVSKPRDRPVTINHNRNRWAAPRNSGGTILRQVVPRQPAPVPMYHYVTKIDEDGNAHEKLTRVEHSQLPQDPKPHSPSSEDEWDRPNEKKSTLAEDADAILSSITTNQAPLFKIRKCTRCNETLALENTDTLCKACGKLPSTKRAKAGPASKTGKKQVNNECLPEIYATMAQKRARMVEHLQIDEQSHSRMIQQLGRSTYSKTPKKRLAETCRIIQKKNTGLLSKAIRPVPRPPSPERKHGHHSKEEDEESDSKDKKSKKVKPIDKSARNINPNTRFPTEKEFKFVKEETLECVNCHKVFRRPRSSTLLCHECELWNHQYCVSPEGFFAGTYHEDECIFCDQMEKLSDREKPNRDDLLVAELEMDRDRIDIQKPDPDAASEQPALPTKKWTLYWNLFKNKYNIKVGNCVYVRETKDEQFYASMWWVLYLITDAKGKKFMCGFNLMLPHEIKREKYQDFYEKEVFPVRDSDILWIPLDDVVGFVSLMQRDEYFSGRSRDVNLCEQDTYLYTFYYNTEEENHYQAGKGSMNIYNYFRFNKTNWAWRPFREPIKIFKRYQSKDGKSREEYKDILNFFTEDMLGKDED